MPLAPTTTCGAPVRDSRGRLPRAVGVYDRPRFRRSRALVLAGAIVVAIVVVWVILLR